MKSRLSTYFQGALCATIAAFSLAVHAAPAPLATVNGKPISATVLDVLVIDQGMQGKPEEAEFRNYAKGELIQREVMAQRARALKLDKSATYQSQLGEVRQAIKQQFDKAPKEQLDARIAFGEQGLLAQLFIDDFEKKNVPTDTAKRTAYKQMVQEKGGTEYKLRHIQLASEADAKAVIAKLAGGAKFESLVAASQDLGSKDDGGDLGWAKADVFPPFFGEAVRKLAAGGFSRVPVKTENGYHVILVEGARELPVGSYESSQAEISEGLKQQAFNKEVQSLLNKAKIK